MIAYYWLLGGLAAVALCCYGLLSFAVLLALWSTLTLPGIAGFVLAIGMAVDANVLVFERMREEHRAGAGIRRALERGFTKAFSAIADSNITTLLAAVLLFFLASGAVRGFGVTLSVGVLVSMFTALVVTRVLVELAVRVGAVHRRPGLLGLEGGGRLAAWLAERGPNLIAKGRWWLAGSLVALLLAGVGMVVRGPNFGVEFTGGRLLEYRTERPVDLDAARRVLADAGFPRAVVQASGDGNLTVRSGRLDPAAEQRLQRAVAGVGGQAEELRDESIGPTIGAELRRKALLALAIALLVQLGYLAMRFRWTFGAAAVIAMFHDVAILLGLFAWLGKPLDGVFLAALLTVVGYSVNDSVVVFDRVRERLRARSREPLATMVNDACLQTVPARSTPGWGRCSSWPPCSCSVGRRSPTSRPHCWSGSWSAPTRRCSWPRRCWSPSREVSVDYRPPLLGRQPASRSPSQLPRPRGRNQEPTVHDRPARDPGRAHPGPSSAGSRVDPAKDDDDDRVHQAGSKA
jgi:SecD/SecF fusion protein